MSIEEILLKVSVYMKAECGSQEVDSQNNCSHLIPWPVTYHMTSMPSQDEMAVSYISFLFPKIKATISFVFSLKIK